MFYVGPKAHIRVKDHTLAGYFSFSGPVLVTQAVVQSICLSAQWVELQCSLVLEKHFLIHMVMVDKQVDL